PRVSLVFVVVNPRPSHLKGGRGLVHPIEIIELDIQMACWHVLDVPAPGRSTTAGVLEPELAVQVAANVAVLTLLVLESKVVPLRHVDARTLEPLLLDDLIFIVIVRVVHEGDRLRVTGTRVLHEVVFAILRTAIRLWPDQDNGVVIIPVAGRCVLASRRSAHVGASTNLPTTTVFGVVEVPHPTGVTVRQAGHNELPVLDDLTFRPSTTVPAVAFPVLARETPFGRVGWTVVLELVAPLSQRRAPVVDHRRLHAVHVVVTSPRAANDAGRSEEHTSETPVT